MNAFPAVRAAMKSRMAFRLLVLVLVGALMALLIWRFDGSARAKGGGFRAPESPAMENSLGIRMDSVQLVGADGIVEVRYTVLDAVKASKFQDDLHHPPVLHSEQHGGDIYRTALMKQGHDLRPGQTYYVLYLNNANAVHRGDTLEIDAGPNRLQHVPVQ